jgi:hypothetical protein
MIQTSAAASASLRSVVTLDKPNADCGKVRQCDQPNLACSRSCCNMLWALTCNTARKAASICGWLKS